MKHPLAIDALATIRQCARSATVAAVAAQNLAEDNDCWARPRRVTRADSVEAASLKKIVASLQKIERDAEAASHSLFQLIRGTE